MDMKLMAAAFALSLIAFVGIATAMPNWNMGLGQRGNETWSGPGGCHGPMDNETWQGQEFMRNETWSGPMMRNETWRGAGMNLTRFNSTEMNQFKQAIQANDYSTAMKLHQMYGFGGLLFDKLNETTFAKYVQIYLLQEDLRKELGLDEQHGPQMGLSPGESGPGLMQGMRQQMEPDQNTEKPTRPPHRGNAGEWQ